MKISIEKRIRRLVTFNRITIFIAKLFGMVSKFKDRENVCLIFDRRKKFLVISNVIIKGKIQLVYFNENSGLIETANIEPQYLDYSYVEGERLEKLVEKFPEGMSNLLTGD